MPVRSEGLGFALSMKKQPIILVVDDEPAILGLVKDILVPCGYLVNTANNGKEALAAIQAHPYDLVLTDMIMPQMGGMELVQYLRLHHPETLVIVFTGFASYQDAVDAVKLGAFDYLPKPLQPEILRHAIERALDYQAPVAVSTGFGDGVPGSRGPGMAGPGVSLHHSRGRDPGRVTGAGLAAARP